MAFVPCIQAWDLNEAAPPSLSEPFNLILAHHALHSVKDLPATMTHISKMLAPGGFLLINELAGPIASCLWSISSKAVEGVVQRSVDDWRAAISAAGLIEVSTLRWARQAVRSYA